jgi:hypothetical protein
MVGSAEYSYKIVHDLQKDDLNIVTAMDLSPCARAYVAVIKPIRIKDESPGNDHLITTGMTVRQSWHAVNNTSNPSPPTRSRVSAILCEGRTEFTNEGNERRVSRASAVISVNRPTKPSWGRVNICCRNALMTPSAGPARALPCPEANQTTDRLRISVTVILLQNSGF